MSAKTSHTPRAPDVLTDRMSGRSADEYAPEVDLSVAERASKAVRAVEEAARASGIIERAGAVPSVVGSREEVSRAKVALKASAKYHARTIAGQELDQALERGEVSEQAAEAVRSQSRERTRDRSRKR